ncbi:MAG TPA: phosphate/phosphite/phosphonate ABC transporter substrate-binding protein [bacterium]|nr:phosphate/phosphite/phosphonate ABC transporter substrate-binding protein [bacterium]
MKKKFFLVLLIFFVMTFIGCSKSSEDKQELSTEIKSEQTLQKSENDTKVATLDRLTFAIVPSSNPVNFYEKIKPLVTYLEKKIERKIIVKFEVNYENIAKSLGEDYDFAMMGAYSYIEANKLNGAEAIVKSIRQGKPHYNALIVAHMSSGLKNIKDLKNYNNLKYGFTDKFASAGFLFPAAELIKAGVDFSKANYKFIKGYDNVLKSLILKSIDIGVCYSGAIEQYLTQDEIKNIVVLKTTDAIPADPIVISKKVAEDKELKSKLTAAFLDLKDTNILSALAAGLDGYAAASDKDYNVLREKINIVNKHFKF